MMLVFFLGGVTPSHLMIRSDLGKRPFRKTKTSKPSKNKKVGSAGFPVFMPRAFPLLGACSHRHVDHVRHPTVNQVRHGRLCAASLKKFLYVLLRLKMMNPFFQRFRK